MSEALPKQKLTERQIILQDAIEAGERLTGALVDRLDDRKMEVQQIEHHIELLRRELDEFAREFELLEQR